MVELYWLNCCDTTDWNIQKPIQYMPSFVGRFFPQFMDMNPSMISCYYMLLSKNNIWHFIANISHISCNSWHFPIFSPYFSSGHSAHLESSEVTFSISARPSKPQEVNIFRHTLVRPGGDDQTVTDLSKKDLSVEKKMVMIFACELNIFDTRNNGFVNSLIWSWFRVLEGHTERGFVVVEAYPWWLNEVKHV